VSSRPSTADVQQSNRKSNEPSCFGTWYLVFQHCPELLAYHVLGDSTTSAVREEHVKKLLFDGIKAVLALVAAGAKGGRPTNEHLPIGRVLLGSACLYLKKGQYADAARLLDTTRRAIATNTPVAVHNLNTEGLLLTPAQVISLLSSMKTTHIAYRAQHRCSNSQSLRS